MVVYGFSTNSKGLNQNDCCMYLMAIVTHLYTKKLHKPSLQVNSYGFHFYNIHEIFTILKIGFTALKVKNKIKRNRELLKAFEFVEMKIYCKSN